MKKIILFVLVIFTLSASAQDFNKYRIGVKLTPNFSWIKPDSKYITSEGNRLSYGFGLITDIHFTENYAIGTGLNIYHTGGELSYYRKTFEQEFDHISKVTRLYKLQYAEIPLTLKMKTNEIGYITWWGQFGIGLAANIRAKSDDEIDYIFTRSNSDPLDPEFPWEKSVLASRAPEDEDIKDDISLFRTSLIIGAGMEYNLSGNFSLVAGITFNNGFSDVLKGNGLMTDDADEVVFENTSDGDRVPVEQKLKGINNFLELTIGVMF